MHNIRLKELQAQYALLTDEHQRLDTYIDIAMEIRNNDVDEAIKMANDIIDRADAIDYPLAKGRGLNLKGWCYWRQGNYDEGLTFLQQAHDIAGETDNLPLKARVLNNFGYIYRDRGDLATAMTFFENALALNEKIKDEVAQAVNLSSIAYVHYDLNDYENALEFALRCLPTFSKAKDNHRLTSLRHILGNIYFKLEQYQEALQCFEQNLAHADQGTVLHALSLSGIGKVYYKDGQSDEAEQVLLEAMEESEKLADVEVQITTNYYLGRLRMDEGSFRRSKNCLETAFELSVQYHRLHDEMSLHEMLSMLYDKMGDVPRAFGHLKDYERLKEEIFQQRTLNKLRNLQTRQQVELAKKEKEVAERTAALKQQFMANMSHEIRTPMNAIVGLTRLLMEKEPQPHQIRYLDAIKQSADNLLVIINDILDLSKIEAGKIIIEQTNFSLRRLMEAVRDMLFHKADEKGLQLRLSIDRGIPDKLVGDPTRISQILINLVGNAIKFTENGFVEFRVLLQSQNQNNCTLLFEIEDSGIGIDADYIDKIFESFTQAGTDTARKFGGTGLGLTISRQLTDLMHGKIEIKSTVGEGTTFTVSIPLGIADSIPEKEEETALSKKDIDALRATRVLLVEDNEFNRMVAVDTLEELLPGIKIDIAVNGAEAVEKVKLHLYDLLLMDIQMPVMNGVEATLIIRQELKPPRNAVKIIAMTANVLQENVQQYLDAGMNGYLSKPFKTEELLQKMSAVLNLADVAQKAENRPEVKPIQETFKPLPERVTDKTFLKQFTGGKEDKIEKYVGMFLENAPRLLNHLDEGLKANDLGEIKIVAHSLKPQLTYMGVKEAVSNIFLIEQTAGGAGDIDKLPELIEHLHLVCKKAFAELSISNHTDKR
ncbi:MAG: tetratricopeptide repeat protein [Chitinophagaceae bacterium]